MVDMTAPYAGDYVRSNELPPHVRLPVIIRFATTEQVGQDQKPAGVLTLARADDGKLWPRKVILNKTNNGILVDAFGRESTGWTGQAITVWNDPDVHYKGERTGGLKVAVGHPAQPPASGAIPLPGPAAASGNGAAASMEMAGHTVPLPGSMPTAPGGGSLDEDSIPF